MNSLINEARGILYFNSSLSGTCFGNPIFRMVQYNPGHCAATQVAAAREVDLQIRQLAPALNTQAYAFDFGPGLDTMLKKHGNHNCLFAMIDGSTQPGRRTFSMPGGMASASTAEVLFENRSVPITGGSVERRIRPGACLSCVQNRRPRGRCFRGRGAGPVTLYSAFGRRLATYQPRNGQVRFDSRDPSIGLYFLRFDDDGSMERAAIFD